MGVERKGKQRLGLGDRPHQGRDKIYQTTLQPTGEGETKHMVRLQPTNKRHAELGGAGVSYLAGILDLGLNLSKKMTKATE